MKRNIIAFFCCLFCASQAYGVSLDWIRQLGSTEPDFGFGVTADGLGNVYVSGITGGTLAAPSAGSYDAFLAKYDSAGGMQWVRQIGTPAADTGTIDLAGDNTNASADGLGNVYIAGSTGGSLGGPLAGSSDAFVAKYDDLGNLHWVRQLGTSSSEVCHGVSADGMGNAYIAGLTTGSLGAPNAGGDNREDAFVSKYDAGGNLIWTRQLGSSGDDAGQGVSADGSGNVFISGYTYGDLGGGSNLHGAAFVSKYDNAGNLQWTRQLGTPEGTRSYDVAADGFGNVFIAGTTSGNLGGPNSSGHAFVAKYDSAGALSWTRQYGTIGQDEASSVSADMLGNVFVASYSTVDGPQVRKYDGDGLLQWVQQLGMVGSEAILSVSAKSLGEVYVSGWTQNELGGVHVGSNDAFVAKYSDPVVPEPSSLLLTALAALWLTCCRRKH